MPWLLCLPFGFTCALICTTLDAAFPHRAQQMVLVAKSPAIADQSWRQMRQVFGQQHVTNDASLLIQTCCTLLISCTFCKSMFFLEFTPSICITSGPCWSSKQAILPGNGPEMPKLLLDLLTRENTQCMDRWGECHARRCWPLNHCGLQSGHCRLQKSPACWISNFQVKRLSWCSHNRFL